MSQANDGSPLPDVIDENPASSSEKPEVLGHVVLGHVDPIVSKSLASSSQCISTHKKHSESHIVEVGLGLTETMVDYTEPPDLASKTTVYLKNVIDSYEDSQEDRPGSFDYMPSQSGGHLKIGCSSGTNCDDRYQNQPGCFDYVTGPSVKMRTDSSVVINDDKQEDRPGSFDYMPNHSGHLRTNCFDSSTWEEDVEDRPGSFDYMPSHQSSHTKAVCSGSICDDNEEDRPGSFDYMPNHISDHVRITHTFNPPFDEEIKLDSSIGSSTIESPRSDNSVTHEEVSITEKVETMVWKETNHKHKHPCWDYTSCGKHSEDEDMEDEEDERDDRRGSAGTGSIISSFPRASTQVDDCIAYNLKPHNGPSAEHKHHIITPTSYTLYKDQHITEDSKEKDKRNIRSKDDSDKPEVPDLVDVNGNPRSLDSANYFQMRQWPRGKSDITSPGNLSSYTPITIPHSHISSASDPNTAFDRKKERRRMKLERLKGTPAEEYKGHRKFSDIKDILAFVEGSNTSSSKTEIRSTKRKQDRPRRKDHHLNGPLTLDDTAGVEDATGEEDTLLVTTNIKPVLNAMGNSFGQTLVENTSSKTWSEEDDDDDIDKNSNEFHDCLNAIPTEFLTSETKLVTSDAAHVHSTDTRYVTSEIKLVTSDAGYVIPADAEYVTSETKLVTSDAQIIISNTKEQHQRLTSTSGNNIKKPATNCTVTDKLDCRTLEKNASEKHSTDNNRTGTKKSVKTKSMKEKVEVTDHNEPISAQSNMVKHHEKSAVTDSLLMTSTVDRGNMKLQKDTEFFLDSSRREDLFTEVKKKSKRPIVKDSAFSGHSVSSFHHSYMKSGHTHYNNHRAHKCAAPPPAVVMSTSAAVSNITSLASNNQTHSSRDLSPSAFPVLSGQGQQIILQKETRRNSCGDIHSDSECVDNKTYDSDRESAKSLPTAHGGARVGADLLPNYQVSYARMAGAPPRKESTNSHNSESGVTSISRNGSINSSITHTLSNNTASMLLQSRSKPVAVPERKATVWKGSPRERRHSIGSSPDDIVEGDKPSVTERNRQCGSQEVLSKSITVSKSIACKAAANSSLPSKQTNSNENSNSVHSNSHLVKEIVTPLVKCISNQVKNTVHAVEQVTRSMTQTSGQILLSSSVPTTSEYATSQVGPTGTSFRPGISSKSTSTSVPSGAQGKMDLVSRKTQQETSVTLPAAAAASSSKTVSSRNQCVTEPDIVRKISSTKSVIFLDKRFDSLPPPNLGITFGFDSSYEPTSQPSSQQTLQSCPSQIQSASQTSSMESSVQPSSSLPHLAASQGHSHIPLSTQSVVSPLPTSLTSESSNKDNSHPGKSQHISGPRNGLILPSNPTESSCITPDQDAGNSGASVVGNSNLNLATFKKTILSDLTPDAVLDASISSDVKSDLSSAEPTNNPLVREYRPDADIENTNVTSAQTNSTRVSSSPSSSLADIGNTNVTSAQTNSTGGTSSPISSLTLLLPQTVTIENNETTSSILSSPSTLENKESTQGNQGLTESILRETASNTSPSAKPEKTPDILETSLTAISAVVPSPTDPATSSQKHLPPTNMLPFFKPVVYGLNIKPGDGCGKLMFVPSKDFKKNKENSAEMSAFLRKKWLKDVVQYLDSGRFVTLTEED